MPLSQETTTESNGADADHRAEHPGTWLRLPCCDSAVHPVRIQKQDEGRIVVSAPREPHATWVRKPSPTDSMTLGWTDAGGSLVLEVRVLPESTGSEWTLEIMGMGDFVQRRRHIRVSTDAEAQLLDNDRLAPIPMKISDMSESGLKVSFTDYIPQMEKNPMKVVLRVDGMVLMVMAELRWSGRVSPIEVNAGFEFCEMHHSQQSRLRAHIMHMLDTRRAVVD